LHEEDCKAGQLCWSYLLIKMTTRETWARSSCTNNTCVLV